MLSILLALIVAATLASGPFWRRDKEHLPLHFWAIYCGFGPATAFGVEPLPMGVPEPTNPRTRPLGLEHLVDQPNLRG